MDAEESFTVLCQIGFQKAGGKRTPGQLVKAVLMFAGGGEEDISWHGAASEDGTFLTDMSERSRCIWYLARRQLSVGDGIRIEVKTANRGRGQDTHLTQTLAYSFDPAAPVQEISARGVLMNGLDYPLVKGRLIEVAQQTERDKIEQGIAEFVDISTKTM